MSEHGHHENVAPPQPDNVQIGQVILWGVGSFLFVVISIVALGGYFWWERQAVDAQKVGAVYEASVPGFGDKIEALKAEEQARLSGRFKLENGKTTMSIEKAMADTAKRFGKN